ESNDLIDIGTTNNFLIIGDHGGQGRFDNVRFWNLDGVKISESVTPTISTSGSEWEVSFANPILTYISDRQPDLEDNFESRSGVWAPADWCADWRMKYESGKLLVDGCYIQYKGAPFTDYVVEVSSSFVSQRGEIGILFRDDLCRMIISQDFGMEASCERFINGELTTTDIIKKEYHPQSSNPFHLRVIAKGGRFAFYLDGEPVGYFEEEALKFGSQLELTFEVGGTIGTLDDFKIWDISELEIP
ncbi:MAG TPA: hypothetical protein VLA72_02550, partial [Anaerolineales bacterium]|nr:hypothetical protein [Anaerolineales bacterium]